MSQSSKRVHFGIPAGRSIDKVVICWPGAAPAEYTGLAANRHYQIVQGDDTVTAWKRPGELAELQPAVLKPRPLASASRTVITARLPMPAINYREIRSDEHARATAPLLVNLWSTTCVPCLTELQAFAAREQPIRAAGLNVIALNVDELNASADSDLSRSKQLVDSMHFPFAVAAIDPDTSGMLDVFHRSFLSLRRPMSIPSSFLVTADGRAAVIYRGPVSVDQVIQDVALLELPLEPLRRASVPFAGRWRNPPSIGDPKDLSVALMRAGFLDAGAKYLERYLLAHRQQQAWGPRDEWPTPERLAELCEPLADFFRLRNEPQGVLRSYQLALEFDPKSVSAHVMLGKGLMRAGQANQGLSLIRRAAELAPASTPIRIDLAISYAMIGKLADAESELQRLLEDHPELNEPHWHLARVYLQQQQVNAGLDQLRRYLSSEPTSVEALRLMAWTLATTSDQACRNIEEAERWAAQLPESVRVTADYLDLAAVLRAARGDFAGAVAQAELAIERLPHSASAATRAALAARLQLYRQAEPYLEPSRPRDERSGPAAN
jgi:tetratricopeptide (TPR) repeat protein